MSKVQNSTDSAINQSAENESIVIDSILHNNSLMEDISLTVSDFTVKENKALFKNMQEQYKEDKHIEFVELFESECDAHYIEKYKKKVARQSVNDITRYVNRMKEASKKQAIKESLKKYASLGTDVSSNEMIEKLSTMITQVEKDSSQNTFSLDIQNLSDVIVEQPEFYLKDFLPLQVNEINLISAAGGSGKSYLGILLLSMLQNMYELNIFAWFSEDTTGFVKDRANKLKAIYQEKINTNFDIAGKGHAMGFVDKGKNGNLQASDFFYFFKKEMQRYNVLLLDPLIQFMGNIDENNNGEVRFFFNLLNTWCEEENKTLIIIHHHNKGSNDADGNKTTSVRGASAIIDAVRVHYSLSKNDPRIKPTKKKKNEQNSKQEKNDGCVHCKVEKANHFKADSVYKIQLFPNEQLTQKSTISSTVIVESNLEILEISKDIDNYDDIPF
ncbi:AAA family ATPase [Sulfurimonas hydrogeniphila]|uniref:AAA family ATPase n=1 Tax=Sulfurimonas hydrogeniphila TaxID=2509341 RepID=UPI00125ECB36|nr:AAA family ATPase [Sulfurimonas hydrogeniphila]